MTKIFNQFKHKTKRKILRNNPTKAETILWQALKGKKLSGYKFRRQYGVERYVIDFYNASKKFAIEIDGRMHFEKEAIEYDKQRNTFLKNLGINILRIKSADVEDDLEGVLKEIEIELKS